MYKYTIYEIDKTSIHSKKYYEDISYEEIAKANNIKIPFNVRKILACIVIDKNCKLQHLEYYGTSRVKSQDTIDCWEFAKKIVGFVQYVETPNYEDEENG